MKATALPRVAKLLSPFDSVTFPSAGAFLDNTVEPPPLNTVNIFAVFEVRGEEMAGTAFRIRNSPHSRQNAPAKQGAATAAAAAAAADNGAVEPPFEVDIIATAILVADPASAKTDSIIPILLLFRAQRCSLLPHLFQCQ